MNDIDTLDAMVAEYEQSTNDKHNHCRFENGLHQFDKDLPDVISLTDIMVDEGYIGDSSTDSWVDEGESEDSELSEKSDSLALEVEEEEENDDFDVINVQLQEEKLKETDNHNMDIPIIKVNNFFDSEKTKNCTTVDFKIDQDSKVNVSEKQKVAISHSVPVIHVMENVPSLGRSFSLSSRRTSVLHDVNKIESYDTFSKREVKALGKRRNAFVKLLSDGRTER